MKSNFLQVAYNLLVAVIDTDLSFNVAIKNIVKDTDLDTNQKNDVIALVGCELRHHFVFNELVKRAFGDLNIKSSAGLLLLLANERFIKKHDENELILFAKEEMRNNGVDLKDETFDEFYSHFKNLKNLIPEDIEQNSVEFLSFRFNIPVYLIKMWQRQFGNRNIYKLLKSISSVPLKTFRVNTNKITRDEFIAKNDSFSAANVEDMVIYNGKGSYKNLDCFKNGLIIPLSLGQKDFLDHLNLDVLKPITVISNWPNNMFLDLSMKLQNSQQFDVVTSSGKEYFNMSNISRIAKLKNVHFYRANISSLITCLSSKYDTVFLFPENSCFEYLRITPDYFLHFKQSSLDELIKNQLSALEECDQFVEDGGQIVYCLPTISYKETRGLISSFLTKHKNYSLVDEKQLLPFDELDSILYYAIIKKVGAASND